MMKKPETIDWIKISVAILILITLIITLINVSNQSHFNKNTLRPWIVPEISGQISIEKGNIYSSIYLSNTGYSPAINVYAYNLLNKNKEFPNDTIKFKIKGYEECKKAIIFPNQEKRKYTNPTKLSIKDIYIAENDSLNQIRNLLLKEDVFMHLYIIYQSPDNKTYYISETFKMKYKKDTDYGIFVDWTYIWSSLDKL